MLGDKAKRVRRKLRALRRVGWTPVSPMRRTRRAVRAQTAQTETASKSPVETALGITSACNAAAVGLELCARRTCDEKICVAARSAAEFLRALVESTIGAASEQGIDARPHTRTCDRLRWEWLASTGMVVDGTPDSRLLSECARILADAITVWASPATKDPIGLGDGIAARLRVASAEAYSLASALQYQRRGELALALT